MLRRSRSGRTLPAVLSGAAAGLIMATTAVWTWTLCSTPRKPDSPAGRELASAADLYRLPSGGQREMLLVRAGPDASGEPSLAHALFPGDDPPREMASVMFANLSPTETWTVDLDQSPLRCRVGGGWEPLVPVASHSRDGAPPLTPADELRLRALGGTESAMQLAPGALRQLLVVLPKSRKIDDITDVTWGDVALIRDRIDLERLRRFRSDGALPPRAVVPLPPPGR